MSEHGDVWEQITDTSLRRAGLWPSEEPADGDILTGSDEMGVHCNNVKIRSFGKILYMAGC